MRRRIAVGARVAPISDAAIAEALWDLVFAGLVTSDTLAPLRARLTGGKTAHRSRAPVPRARLRGPSGLALLSAGRAGRAGGSGRSGSAAGGVRRGTPPSVVGRWSLVPDPETDPTVRAAAAAEVLLDRHGIVTRGAVVAEGTPGGFAGVYRVLATLEETGRIRRGYFVEGLGAAQFASAGAVDRVRGFAGRPDQEPTDGPRPGAGRRRSRQPVRGGTALAGSRFRRADVRRRRHRGRHQELRDQREPT